MGRWHGLVGKDLVPATEGLVGGDGDAAIFVSPCDQFKENPGFSLIFVGVGNVVEDDQVEFIEFGRDYPELCPLTW